MTEKERLDWEINQVLNNKINPRESIMISKHTPRILQRVGLEDLPILFSQGHIKNCLHEKGKNPHWHGLKKSFLININDYLSDPCIILDSLNRDDSVVCVLNAVDEEGLPIVASIDFNGLGQYEFKKLNSNYLTSIYGHENIENLIIKSIDLDRLLYVNKKNTTELGNLSQLPLLRGLPQLGYIDIIRQSQNIVNFRQSSPDRFLVDRDQDRLRSALEKYFNDVFDRSGWIEITTSPEKIDLFYTTTEDEIYELQIDANIIDYELNYYANDVLIFKEKFNDAIEMMENIQDATFDGFYCYILDRLLDYKERGNDIKVEEDHEEIDL